ncbi:hypothetical protein C8R44DRAFT_839124 [Mycena epipterygia]|nr:hypothetical protein C8R44DRAFT_839124 [Mycena epipterygia]
MYRWLEQYERKHAELMRVIERFRRDSEVWVGLGDRADQQNGGINGAVSFARMQAAMYKRLEHNARVVFKSADSGAHHDWVSATTIDELVKKMDGWRDVVFRWMDDMNLQLQLPTVDETNTVYRRYYAATSNAAVVMAVCAVCAREVDLHPNQMAVERLDYVPNSHRLVPTTPHPAHDLFNGRLLEPAGVTGINDGRLDPSTLQRGMRGTVSTYDLDSEGISKMVAGDLMPRPPEVLASVISVTYVGLGELPKNWLRNTFRVRRDVVRPNIPKYYGHITIDAARIHALPEDDVPVEITSIIRQSSDTGIIDQESDGYVPQHEEFETEADADVIPLDVTGTIDTDLSKLNANEMMSWGLANLWKEDKEGGYAVRHGRRPVNDFGQPQDPKVVPNPNRPIFFEQAFPCLFPYGKGGLEADRPVKLGFADHIKWALQYHDRRFRRHETFPFVVFGISQQARLMATITKEKLEEACREEEKKLPISDPAVRMLRQHVHATAGRVSGSNQSRTMLRSQLWSTSIYLRPWNLWITNPTDIHDPIAQVFAGENIDLNNFVAAIGPDSEKRAQNIAADPYAAAKFFHFMIWTILETLFGIEITPFQVRSSMGILGEIAAYFGFVEAQNRASLHLHMLVSLKHAPNPDEMLEFLKQESFRARISAYIQANIRAYLPGLETAESVKQIPVEKEIAYNRPPNPDAVDYSKQLRDFELRLARTEQTHTCQIRRCLVTTKSGRLRRKRRAFETSQEDFIDETGKWGPKRLYAFMNGWIPGILVNVRCNNDAKLLTNGEDTQNVTYYVNGYAAKSQQRNNNISAILAKGFAYHLANLNSSSTKYVDDLRDVQRLLLFRLVHAINREQELGAPMVISYLMGWGDTYPSHRYAPIYWSSFVGALFRAFPALKKARSESTVRSEEREQDESSDKDRIDEISAELAAEDEARQAEVRFPSISCGRCCVNPESASRTEMML